MSAKSLDLSWSWILVILVNDEIYELINIKLYTVINQLKYGIFVVNFVIRLLIVINSLKSNIFFHSIIIKQIIVGFAIHTNISKTSNLRCFIQMVVVTSKQS